MADTDVIVSDLIEGARWQEKDGVVISIERVFIVKVFGETPPPDPSDQTGVPGFPQRDEGFNLVLAANGLPVPGQPHPIRDELFVRNRTPVPLGPNTFKVTIQYSLPGGGAFDPPFGTEFMMSGGASVEQIETPNERNGETQITVTHLGDEIGGMITPTEGRAVMRFGAAIPHLSPWAMANFWVNKVNTGPFQPYEPGIDSARTWLITEMNYELAQRNTPTGFPIYEFTLVMSHNPDTWDPVIVYIDKTTGLPPKGLVQGVGIKKINWHFTANFNALFT